MNKELMECLYKKFPELFIDKDTPDSRIKYGCTCGNGWFNLIYSLSSMIYHHIYEVRKINREHGAALIANGHGLHVEPPELRFVQIKEKFGQLRIYAENSDPYMDGLIGMVETISAQVCEDCGNAGVNKRITPERIWVQTLCNNCRQRKKVMNDYAS